jgi:hypothetical protein
MTPETRTISEELFQRIQREFLEMPSLRLTQPQACRLWGMDRELCVKLLARLVDAKFLMRTQDGNVVQLDRRHVGAYAVDRPVELS